MNKQYITAAALLSSSLLLTSGTAWAENTSPSEFPDKTLSSWKEKVFQGNTQYDLIEEDGTRILRAQTKGNASVLYKKAKIDLTKTPWLDWSWKVDGIYTDINEQTKEGDDFPARLYVVAKTGLLPWDTLAINYVWSSNQDLDTHWSNPFVDKAHMVTVQSGAEHVGQWVQQRRNIAEDFKLYFNVDIKKLDGYAVMIDGDNAGKSGTAYFGNISFSDN